jgi:hypothetical protein
MKKQYIVMLGVLVFVLCAVQAFAAYDQAAVKAAMQKNASLYGEASKAAAEKDYFTAADKLMEIAKVFKSLDVINPDKAPKADWDRIHKEMIKAAFRGIGACADEDDAKLKAALDDLAKFRGEGHGMFRK